MIRRLFILAVVLACCAFQRATGALYVDLQAKRILVLPNVEDDWRVCVAPTPAGPAGGCVTVASLRAAATKERGR